ncbi:unnamed protein product [Sphagnum jensenii]|uniref:Uncharacterized protein n=1 Tax=Sphagnum jensenii TaxID=128206 RepID=A0ABP1BA90_9BRYO
MRPRGQSRSVQILTSQTAEFLINRTLFPAQTSPYAWCEPMSEEDLSRDHSVFELQPQILDVRAAVSCNIVRTSFQETAISWPRLSQGHLSMNSELLGGQDAASKYLQLAPRGTSPRASKEVLKLNSNNRTSTASDVHNSVV